MIKSFVWPVDLSMIDLLDANENENENEIKQLPIKNRKRKTIKTIKKAEKRTA